MHRRHMAWLILLIMATVLFGGCAKKEEPAKEAEPVTLTVAGGWTDFRALEVTANAFTKLYPNCTIVYEYVQNYYESVEKRMIGENVVDLFTSTNIQEGSSLLPYAQDLYSLEGLDLSNTFDGLIQNFTFRSQTDEKARIYAVPLGAEMRGLYVNKTLLDSLGIAIPTNQETLIKACETLKANGYIAFHGNPGSFSQLLIYPWICSLIANAEDQQATYNKVNAREAGISELFREPYAFLYKLVENGYYDYKRAQTELNLYTETTDEAYVRDFLHIVNKDGAWVKESDVGQVAFMPSTMSLENVLAKAKDDYHSQIEYVFVPAPVGVDGGYVYLSPAHGIAVCKNSPNLEWAVKFLNFLFTPENNEVFAQAFNVIPNTKEAFTYISKRFDVPESRISHLGQVTFNYGFYDTLTPSMIDLSKANNPKYMQDDGSGNLTLTPLDTFMAQLDADLQP